jgi:excisionase family DNA binding protein
MEPIAYRIADAAKAVGLSRSRLYELIADGTLEARKIGNCTVIPAESLRALVANALTKVAA